MTQPAEPKTREIAAVMTARDTGERYARRSCLPAHTPSPVTGSAITIGEASGQPIQGFGGAFTEVE